MAVQSRRWIGSEDRAGWRLMLGRLWRWLTHERQHRDLLDRQTVAMAKILRRDVQSRRDLAYLERELNLLLAARRNAPDD